MWLTEWTPGKLSFIAWTDMDAAACITYKMVVVTVHPSPEDKQGVVHHLHVQADVVFFLWLTMVSVPSHRCLFD